MEQCPLCFKSFPLQFLERHVNSCLDTLEGEPDSKAEGENDELPTTSPDTQNRQRGESQVDESKDTGNVFAALGLKSQKSSEKTKKASATLTSILIAEKKLKRKQQELENRIKRRTMESNRPIISSSPVAVDSGASHGQSHREMGTQHSTQGTKQDAQYNAEQDAQHNAEQDAQHNTEQSGLNSNGTEQKETVSTAAPKTAGRTSYAASDSTKAAEYLQLKRESELPLAQRLRPKSLDDYFGQEKLMGPHGVLRNLIQSPNIPSFILWGVPGVGKTSLARLVAKTSNHMFLELSGADSNAKKLKEAFAQAQNEKALTGHKTILFLDEIHRFNKATQDLLLPVIEKGTVVVIGATTENPSFTLNNALLSRMHTFVMEPLHEEALVKILNRGLLLLNKTRKFIHNLHLIALDRSAIDHIAKLSSGDSRVALNILESVNAYLSGLQVKEFEVAEKDKEVIDIPPGRVGVIRVSQKDLQPLLSSRNYHQQYDRKGENHYDAISAFHKSVRGSDADAAMFYLVRMLKGGEDPLFIARRMIVIASEDIGLRDSSCLPFAIAAMEAVQFVGMPEGEIVLAHCAAKLARAPKSTKSYRALRKAQSLISENSDIMAASIPMHLRNAPTALMKDLGYGHSYKYNPNFKHGIVNQTFMPAGLEDVELFEKTHLGTQLDEDVDTNLYEKADQDEQSYNAYKKWKKERETHVGHRSGNKGDSEFPPLTSEGERLMSYDENLSRDDQPEFFDGTETDIHVPEF